MKASKQLGETGIEIPPLVFGATSLGNLFKEIPAADKSEIVASWFNAGLEKVVIDSAGKYGAGMSLEVIGQELERLGVGREEVLISNKLAWRRIPLKGTEPTFEPGAWFGLSHDAVQDISYEGILRCWEDGEKLLGKYSAQLVSVHDPDEYLDAAKDAADRESRVSDIVGAYRALTELRDSGKVSAVGMGAKNWRVIKELSEHCKLDWVMFANSLTIMNHPAELIEFMYELGRKSVGIINSALFHGGFLLGGDFFDYQKLDLNSAEDQSKIQWRDSLRSICDEYGYSVFDVGVAFGRAHPAVTAIALSSSRADRTPSHVEAVDFSPSDEFWQGLKSDGLLHADCDLV